MKLDKYILQLLQENETAIIPGFGAFFSNYRAAVINEETEEIFPPGKTLEFNQKVRNNDGLLVGIIAENENISHFDALKKIEKERDNIVYKLDKGESVTLDKIGTLRLLENKEIHFEKEKEANVFIDSFGLETASLIEAESKQESSLNMDSDSEKGKQEDTEDNKDKQGSADAKKQAKDLPVKTAVPDSEKQTEKQEVTEPATEPFLDNKKKEKKKRAWMWLFLFFPIIIAGYFVFIQNNSKKNEEPELIEQKTVQEKIQPLNNKTSVDSLVKDSVKLQKTDSSAVTPKKSEVIIQPKLATPYYVLVGGSFTQKSNADKFFIELKGKGFEPFHLGKRGNFFLIGIGKYKTFREAETAKSKFIEENHGSGAWIKREE